MKDLVLNEILEPDDEEECTLTLDNPYKITRCTTSKAIKTISQNKKCKLVFGKHIIDHDSLQSYLYGYKCVSNVKN